MDATGDDVAGGLVEVRMEESGKLEELWPENTVEHGRRGAKHDGAPSLTILAVGIDAIASAERDE